jgi:micrococcal nuclease
MTVDRFAAMVVALACLAGGPATSADQTAAPPQHRGAPPSPASELRRVRQVIDGDTLTVSGIGTVRLIGVDAPEKTGGYREPEPFGDQATAFLKRQVEGKLVRLEYDGERKDRYNRTLAYVFLEDGTLVNEAVIRAGWAEFYRSFDYRRKKAFEEAEREARAARRGIWKKTTP